MTNPRLAIILIENIENYNQQVNTNGKISIIVPRAQDLNEFIKSIELNLKTEGEADIRLALI